MKKIENYNLWIDEYGNVINQKGHTIKPILTNKGYYCVRPRINTIKKYFAVHREVAKAYIPNPNNLNQVGHKDHNKKNNHYTNLYWTNNSENQKSNREIGKGVGSNSRSKLTIEDVRFIRKVCKPFDKEYGYYALGKKYKVHASEIRRIHLKKRWLVD